MVYVPGCTAYLHPDRNPLNPNGYKATRNTPYVCHIRPQSQSRTEPQSQTGPLPQPRTVPVIRQPGTAPIPQPRTGPQSEITEAQRERIEALTTQYKAVVDLVQSGSTLQQALLEVHLNMKMFQRRRTIAEAYIAHPEARV